jgi:hypothetical protein
MELIKKSLLVLLLFSTVTHASSDKEIKELMNTYLKSIHAKDVINLKKITTNSYLKKLKNSYLNSNIKQTKKFKAYSFDIKINKANLDKNQYWVNIKDKTKKDYSDYWYIIEKNIHSFKISDMVHIEE